MGKLRNAEMDMESIAKSQNYSDTEIEQQSVAATGFFQLEARLFPGTKPLQRYLSQKVSPLRFPNLYPYP